jgi:hypothetical protein
LKDGSDSGAKEINLMEPELARLLSDRVGSIKYPSFDIPNTKSAARIDIGHYKTKDSLPTPHSLTNFVGTEHYEKFMQSSAAQKKPFGYSNHTSQPMMNEKLQTSISLAH